MELHIVVLCLVASILTSATCYPNPSSKRLTEPAGAESYNLTSNYFKEPSQTHYIHPNSVYYDSKSARAPAQEIFLTGPNQSSDEEKFANKEQETGSTSSELYSHYNKERAEQGEKGNAPSQGKLYDALRELAAALEAIQTERYNLQLQQRKDSPQLKSPVYNVRTEKVPNFPPFTPELYPKADAGPLSILEQLGDSTGTLW